MCPYCGYLLDSASSASDKFRLKIRKQKPGNRPRTSFGNAVRIFRSNSAIIHGEKGTFVLTQKSDNDLNPAKTHRRVRESPELGESERRTAIEKYILVQLVPIKKRDGCSFGYHHEIVSTSLVIFRYSPFSLKKWLEKSGLTGYAKAVSRPTFI